MQNLTKIQQLQEERYAFPYHYLDLEVDEYRLINHVQYVSRLNIVKDLLKPFQGQWVLDAGCGDGRFCYELRNENLNVVGVDLSERALAFAKAFSPSVEFYAQDLKNLSLAYQFDFVVMIETLEHLIPEEIPQILQSIASVLKPEGKLIVTVPSSISPVEPKHYQHFSEASLKHTLLEYFQVKDGFGHSKVRNIGLLRRFFYWRMKRLASWLYPFRHNEAVLGLFEYLNNYYMANLRFGKPDECLGIIAVCEKV